MFTFFGKICDTNSDFSFAKSALSGPGEMGLSQIPVCLPFSAHAPWMIV